MNSYEMVDVSPQVSIMLCNNKPVRAFVDVNELAEDLNKLIEKAKLTVETAVKERKLYGSIKFKKCEIKRMHEPFRTEFKKAGGIACVTKTFGEDGITYKIWYCRNGYNIKVSDSNLIEAKRKFILKVI